MKVQVREELERRKRGLSCVCVCVCVCLRIARHCNDDDDSESAQLSSAPRLAEQNISFSCLPFPSPSSP